MSAWITVISAIFQLVLLLVQAYAAKDADTKASKVAMSKEIKDAVSSGDISRINHLVQQLRNK